MFVDFFIKRPVFAAVCSTILVLAGAVTIPTLPIAQYPNIVPPQVVVTANYTGASAEVVESAVTVPLEQQINGVEGLKYLTSASSNDGTSTITATFDLSRDVDLAAVDVQNRVNTAQGRLPNEVKTTGITIAKSSSAIIAVFGMYTENNEYSNAFISNYADLYVKNALQRIKGVGNVQIIGERKYAMRLWLDPSRLANRGLTAGDVVSALQEQNVQVAAGSVGKPPIGNGQSFQISIRAIGRLKDPKEFGEIVIKKGRDGNLVQFKDVGRVELGAEDYSTFFRFSGKEAVAVLITQLPKANALEIDQNIRSEMLRISQRFPPGLKYRISFDPTTIVGDSINEVVLTLGEAILLVVAVIFLFLQDWRSTLIPAITIPVSLIGTFIFVKLVGFSINTLTLFGLTLATGLVVDDAIVVIENIARFIQEKGMRSQKAASAAMGEVTGAVIATALVLIAVFVPVAFFPGTTGQLYKQFALTIAFSVLLSAFNALTLTPALSALLLQPETPKGPFFRAVNAVIDAIRRGYKASLVLILQFKIVVMVFFAASLGLTYWLFTKVPPGFVPIEDQGYFAVAIQAPAGVSVEYTNKVMLQVEKLLQEIPEVQDTYALGGFSFTGNASNKATIFPALKPLPERKGENQSAGAIIGRIRGKLLGIKEAIVIPFPPPAIQGLGNFGGFQFEIQDLAGGDLGTLAQTTYAMMGKGNATPGLTGLFSSFTANDPQLVIQVDRKKAKALGISLTDLFSTLQVFMGSAYINDFDFLNRSYRVYVQADQNFRTNPDNIKQFYVRTGDKNLISLANVIQATPTTTAQLINHYNLFRSTEINGNAAPGYSSGQAIAAMQELAKEILPAGMTYSWSGISLEEQEAGSQAVVIFSLGIVFVFLVLAAQYESFVDPLIILLAVPLAILGALTAQSLRGLENDVFCQIGLVMLIGLASKNAILIVEFANQLQDRGLSIADAALESAQTRLRPILMTSLAFILGILPLVFAEGAGSASRHSLGTAVFGGMIVSTILSLYIIPVLYIVINTIRGYFIRDKRRIVAANNAEIPEATNGSGLYVKRGEQFMKLRRIKPRQNTPSE
jgi:hydrophobic/amphiphilic exporter-1 (mainly G- bacteria), HAE1 family